MMETSPSASFRLDKCDVESTLSSTSSRVDNSNKYVLKTLCFSRKSTTMPSKDEYSLLLSNGLGARKWQVGLNSDAEEFRHAILNIYPRLATTTGYTLWNVKKDKSFEKLPVKVNTPSRIRAYLGYQFTGCLIIMPLEEMVLVPSLAVSGPRETPTDTDDMDSGYRSQNSNSRHRQSYSSSQSRPSASFTSNGHRQICMICRRSAKQQASMSFYDIKKQRMTTIGGYATVAEKLMELLNLNMPRSVSELNNAASGFISEEICRRCYRQLNEIDFLEAQLKRSKAEFMSNFLQKLVTSKSRESTGSNESYHRRVSCDSFGSENLCVPQRVYLTPAAYRDAFERHDKNTNYSSRTLNVVPVRLNYGSDQLSSAETMSDCFQSEKSSSMTRGQSEDVSGHRRRAEEQPEDYSDRKGHDQQQQQGGHAGGNGLHSVGRRDVWYHAGKYADEDEDEGSDDERDRMGARSDGRHSPSGRHTITSAHVTSSAATSTITSASMASEVKRKGGVARVEAFLDMMSYKTETSTSSSSPPTADVAPSSASSPTMEKSKSDETIKNFSTTPTSSSPSPLNFSSSSPDESLSSVSMNKLSSRPRPWKKRHRHFDLEASTATDLSVAAVTTQAGGQPRTGSKREFETCRSPISHKHLRTNKEPSSSNNDDRSGSCEGQGHSGTTMNSDEEITGPSSSCSSGSDSSLSSNNSDNIKGNGKKPANNFAAN